MDVGSESEEEVAPTAAAGAVIPSAARDVRADVRERAGSAAAGLALCVAALLLLWWQRRGGSVKHGGHAAAPVFSIGGLVFVALAAHAAQPRIVENGVACVQRAVVTTTNLVVRALTRTPSSLAVRLHELANRGLERRLRRVLRLIARAVSHTLTQTLIDDDMPSALRAFLHDSCQRATVRAEAQALQLATDHVLRPLRLRVSEWLHMDGLDQSAEPVPAMLAAPPPLPHPRSVTRPPLARDHARDASHTHTQLVARPHAVVRMHESDQPAPAMSALSSLWSRARASVLYATCAYDRSVWAHMRQPGWWAITLLGAVPLPAFSFAWWLLLFTLRNVSDEYQLVDFIVSYEVSRFLSTGCVGTLAGAARYYVCVAAPTQASCQQLAPQMHAFDVAVFVLQSALVAWAFHRLRGLPVRRTDSRSDAGHPKPATPQRAPNRPHGSSPHALAQGKYALALALTRSPAWVSPVLSRFVGHTVATYGAAASSRAPLHDAVPATTPASDHIDAAEPGIAGASAKVLQRLLSMADAFAQRGGALQGLYLYHVACVGLSAIAGVSVILADAWYCGGRDLCAPGFFAASTLYWIRTLYGLACVVYLPFKVPIIMQLYVCKHATGYDAAGNTRPVAPRTRSRAR